MKHALRLPDYLEHMQQAVVFNLVVLGEAASNVLSGHADFAAQHTEVPWRVIRATRNRMAHGYFDINIDVIWDTVQTALPQLLAILSPVVEAARLAATVNSTQPPTATS